MIKSKKIYLSEKQLQQKERYKRFLVAMFDKNLSQADIAEMIGTSQQFVCNLMWGQRKSRAKEKQICEILGLEYKEVV